MRPALAASIERTAGVLQRQRVRVLAIAADNSPDWVVVDHAARLGGIVVVPLPPFFSAGQIAHVLEDAGIDAIAADDFGSAYLQSLPTNFVAALTPSITLLGLPARAEPRALPPATAKISYTSGTTGAPKGVCLTRDAMDTVAAGLNEATADLGIGRHLCLLPLATLLENIAGVDAPLLAGAEIELPSLSETGLIGAAGIDVPQLLRCLHEYEPESVILLPQMLSGLVGALEQGARLPESLRFAAVGGAVVGLPLLERADLAGIPVYEGYGLTECCSVVALNTPGARRAGSVGRPLPQCRVRIGRDSEVFVSGPVMVGYVGGTRPQAGEIATGDIGYLDDDGFLFINGRSKNVLITSFGRNVSPEWVEAALTASTAIAQAAVFGDGRPFNVAVIVADGNSNCSDIERAVAIANAGLPDYARIRHWVLAAEPFSPARNTATANGRIRRGPIAGRYATEVDACYRDQAESYA